MTKAQASALSILVIRQHGLRSYRCTLATRLLHTFRFLALTTDELRDAQPARVAAELIDCGHIEVLIGEDGLGGELSLQA